MIVCAPFIYELEGVMSLVKEVRIKVAVNIGVFLIAVVLSLRYPEIAEPSSRHSMWWVFALYIFFNIVILHGGTSTGATRDTYRSQLICLQHLLMIGALVMLNCILSVLQLKTSLFLLPQSLIDNVTDVILIIIVVSLLFRIRKGLLAFIRRFQNKF